MSKSAKNDALKHLRFYNKTDYKLLQNFKFTYNYRFKMFWECTNWIFNKWRFWIFDEVEKLEMIKRTHREHTHSFVSKIISRISAHLELLIKHTHRARMIFKILF